ncbi:MAG: HlyD family efflux transporter periplasmic adaptor subunit, partial [candidate division Zixibacteria bacterium]|nr:HlyD family efflux transporter periplasmic adaptor subunit [candidate division Zixibacteria bacterium]
QEYFNNCSFDNKLQNLPDTDNQKIKLFLSRFNVYKLYFAVRDLEIKLSKHYFYAPFNGSIVTTNMRAGSTARVGSLLGEIINLEKLEVEVPVSVQDVQWINHKTKVKLFSSEISGEWSGQINRIGKTIDSRTQTVQVFISIDDLNQLQIYEGVFFQVEIAGFNIENAISIPHKALYNEKYVYLIENGRLHFQ